MPVNATSFCGCNRGLFSIVDELFRGSQSKADRAGAGVVAFAVPGAGALRRRGRRAWPIKSSTRRQSPAVTVPQPKRASQCSRCRRQREKERSKRADLPAERGAEHGGAQDVVGQQTGQPFFAGHLGRFAFQLDQAHLGFEVAQVQFDVPAQTVEFDQCGHRIFYGVGQGSEQVEGLRAIAFALEGDDQQPSGRRRLDCSRVGAGRRRCGTTAPDASLSGADGPAGDGREPLSNARERGRRRRARFGRCGKRQSCGPPHRDRRRGRERSIIRQARSCSLRKKLPCAHAKAAPLRAQKPTTTRIKHQ